MTDAEFQQLLDEACDVAAKHRELSNKVSEECIVRFGYQPCDLDIDCVIDAVDYGLRSVTVATVVEEYEWTFKTRGIKKNEHTK